MTGRGWGCSDGCTRAASANGDPSAGVICGSAVVQNLLIGLEMGMPVQHRPTDSRRGAGKAPKPRFNLRLPDVSAAPVPVVAPATEAGPAPSAPVRDAIGVARAKLSEKRFLEGHRQVTGMIEDLRNRRRRLFKRLWAASILLTALSVVALTVELLQRTDLWKSFGESAQTEDHSAPRPLPKVHEATPLKAIPPKSGAPREWSNQLPEEGTVESAIFETSQQYRDNGVWLKGTITDNETESQRRGDLHDEHQSRTP